jgi:arylsulfatase A-like enzyme
VLELKTSMNMDRRSFLSGTLAGLALAASGKGFGAPASRPNIIFILSDDIGYADLGCYGAEMVRTPNLNRLAEQGVRFTDAHSTAAVCSPSRYSLLTGRYAFRNLLADYILSGVSPLCIGPDEPTLPGILRHAGYATGLVGKWHLGLGTQDTPVDYNKEIHAGPLQTGFDYAFYMPATGDRVPCVYIENHSVVGLDPSDPIRLSYRYKVGDRPTGLGRRDLLKIKADLHHSGTIINGISRIGYMGGGEDALWVDEEIADTFTSKAVSFIEQNRDRPFFFYYSPHDIHEPMVPHPRFRGTSDCGSRGDVIHQLDWSVGKLMAALERTGIAENTLIIFSSDNGGAIKNTYNDGTNHLHSLQPPNGELRGKKGSLFEGGHRVPFIARWPARIAAGSVCDELIGQVDMLPTLAAAAGILPPKDEGPDAVNVLPALLGETRTSSCRDHLVMQLFGQLLAMRKGPWKLIPFGSSYQNFLFNLEDDLSESHNLAFKHPGKVLELQKLLWRIKAQNGK